MREHTWCDSETPRASASLSVAFKSATCARKLSTSDDCAQPIGWHVAKCSLKRAGGGEDRFHRLAVWSHAETRPETRTESDRKDTARGYCTFVLSGYIRTKGCWRHARDALHARQVPRQVCVCEREKNAPTPSKDYSEWQRYCTQVTEENTEPAQATTGTNFAAPTPSLPHRSVSIQTSLFTTTPTP